MIPYVVFPDTQSGGTQGEDWVFAVLVCIGNQSKSLFYYIFIQWNIKKISRYPYLIPSS